MRQQMNGTWKLKIDPEELGIVEGWMNHPLKTDLEIHVPGCIQQLDLLAEKYPPHDDLRNGYLGTFFMEREFQTEERMDGERYRLVIGGAGPTCHIWVNGVYVSRNIMSLNRFETDITDFICHGCNRLTIAITEQYDSLFRGMRFEDFNWSGIYGKVYVETTGSIRFSEGYLSLRNGKCRLIAGMENLNVRDFHGCVEVEVENRLFSMEMALAGNTRTELAMDVDIKGLPRWSFRNPKLISVRIHCNDPYGRSCETTFRTGLREIETRENRILMDGVPVFFAGAGEEYYSPTIAPLTDQGLIRRRFEAMQKYGFNFFRYHTHIPTEEELAIADEMGMMIALEFGIVSNFHKMEPTDKALIMYGEYIRQTRHHPSLVIYGLGNEGSQLMIHSARERETARIGYDIIRKNTDNQFGIIAFGIQGELRELPNDIETPHLWSENFVWAYDGLTDVPWKALEDTVGDLPNILHEFGKYTVWPSLVDEVSGTLPMGAAPQYGRESHAWLLENELSMYEEQLVTNSRRAVTRYIKTALEEARRQSFVSGYVLWTFFRDSRRNRGLCDDVGHISNGEEDLLCKGANAEITLLMDRGFRERTLPCELSQRIQIFVSNFSRKPAAGSLHMRMECDGEVICEKFVHNVSVDMGHTENVSEFLFVIPAEYSGKKLLLRGELMDQGNRLGENCWEFWAYDTSCDRDTPVYLHIDNPTLYRRLKKIFPRGYRLSSVDSIVIGCESWTNPRLAETAEKYPKVLLIADTYDKVVRECINNGVKVLLLDGDGGGLPEEWFWPPLFEELQGRDTSQFLTSFRSGWDQGNLATIVEDHPLLEGFSHEGYCGLQFFDMMQSARSLNIRRVDAKVREKTVRVISSLAKCRVHSSEEDVLQDNNAVREHAERNRHTFCAREQGYFVIVGEKIFVSTLHMTDNPAGIFLLKQVVKKISG